METMDLNNDGKVSFEEFHDAMLENSRVTKDDRIDESKKSGPLIAIEDINAMSAETDPAKQKEMSEKIFKTIDADNDGSLDKIEMMALVEAFWKAIPAEMKHMMKQFGMSESEGKNQMQESIFN